MLLSGGIAVDCCDGGGGWLPGARSLPVWPIASDGAAAAAAAVDEGAFGSLRPDATRIAVEGREG